MTTRVVPLRIELMCILLLVKMCFYISYAGFSFYSLFNFWQLVLRASSVTFYFTSCFSLTDFALLLVKDMDPESEGPPITTVTPPSKC